MLKRITFSLFVFLSLAVVTNAQSTPPSADQVMQNAMQRAGKEHKKVFIIFHASWCGWCHRMDSIMNSAACKKLFNDNYVIGHLTVMESDNKKDLENPGAEDLLKKYNGEGQGIPFWLIFDAKGNLVADCLMPPKGTTSGAAHSKGENTGCPSTMDEVAYFVKVLKKTSSLNSAQLAIIQKNFWMK